MGKVKILYLIDTLIEMAGTERNLCEVASRLDRKRYDAEVVCLRGGRAVARFRQRGIAARDLGVRRIYGPRGILQAVRLFLYVRKRACDIIVTCGEGSDLLGLLIGRTAGVRAVLSNRRDMGYGLKRRHLLAYRVLNRLFDRIMTVSEAVRQEMLTTQGAPAGRTVVVHNGVDVRRFDPSSAPEAGGGIPLTGSSGPVVGMVAVLRPVKGHRYFVEAARLVARYRPDARFLLVGWHERGDYAREVRELIQREGLEERFFYAGGRMNVAGMFASMDIAVTSSLNEGFPNVVLEAMASGKPVIATSVGGTPEAVVDGETGFLVPPADPRSLAQAMLRLLNDEALRRRMGAGGRERVLERFTMERMMADLASLYETVIAEKRYEREVLRIPSVKRALKSGLSTGIYHMRLLSVIRRVSGDRKGIRILAYHRIADDPLDYLGLSVSVDNFEKQIRYLSAQHTILPLEEAVRILAVKGKAPEDAIVLTFDDGFRDNFLNGFPVLRKYGVPATVFLSVESIDANGSVWFETVNRVFKMTRRTSVDLRLFDLGRHEFETIAERMALAGNIIARVKYLGKEMRKAIIESLAGQLGMEADRIPAQRAMLSWDDVLAMKDAGVSFGSHGMSHTILTNLTDEEIDYEAAESKRIIRDRTGIEASVFAYPNGGALDFNKSTGAVLRRNGYISACTLIKGSNGEGTDLMELRRICVCRGIELDAFGRFSKSSFAVNVSGIYRLLSGRSIKQEAGAGMKH